jgi:hypothetical protein
MGLLAVLPVPGSAGEPPVTWEPAQRTAVSSLVGADLGQCAAPKGAMLAMCPIGPAKAVRGVDAPIWLPPWCYSKPQDAWHHERFDTCGIIAMDWGVYRYPDRAQVGGFRLTEYHYSGVFPLNFTPTMEYWRWGEYSELARHIQEAQWSGLPGAPGGSPLTRLTDGGLQELNRTFACPGHYPRPPGRSCDEYPFASTWQGAYTSGSSAHARTQSWCQVDEPVTTGPYGWSVCMIDDWQNSAGGGALGNWFVANRVISGDPFYVHIS